jgi:tetratricopeptide (TPR) repeat protein
VKFALKSQITSFQDDDDRQFEEKANQLIIKEAWEDLEQEAVDQLDSTNALSHLAFYFLGVALFKMKFYDQAVKAFQKSSELKADDAQL